MPPFLRTRRRPLGRNRAAPGGGLRGGPRSTAAVQGPAASTAVLLVLVAVAGLTRAPGTPSPAALVVGATFPAGSALGLAGPNGAQLFALLLSTGWVGSQAAPRRSWVAPAADQVLATAGILLWAAPSQAWENLFFSLLLWGSWGVGLLTRRAPAAGRTARPARRPAGRRTGGRRGRGGRGRTGADRPRRARLGGALGERDGAAAGGVRTTVARRAGRHRAGGRRAAGPPVGRRAARAGGLLREEPGAARAAVLVPGAGAADEVRAAGLPVELEVTASRGAAAGARRLRLPGGAGGAEQRAAARGQVATSVSCGTSRRPRPAGGRRGPVGAGAVGRVVGGHGLAGCGERSPSSAALWRPARGPRAASGCAARFPLQDVR